MRWAAALSCVALALVTAGCDPQDRAYIREGIGTRLSAPDAGQAIRDEDDYFRLVCELGGCETPAAFVQTGMNDIDRRCDAYLTWLDARRRDREPILNQINAVATTTGAIMAATSVGAVPLAIAGQAFGLISASYSNWNSRLLLVVDHSTVQTVVYTRQTDFRNRIATEVVPDRARAIYLLRNYLRICLPITIETDINTSVKLAQMGAGAEVKLNPVVQTSRPVVIRSVNTQIGRFTPPPPPVTRVSIGPYESRMQQKEMNDILATLGCTGKDLGPAGSPARLALSKFLTDNGQPASDRVTNDVAFTIRELKSQGKKGTCGG